MSVNKQAYMAFVRPLLGYACFMWDHHSIKLTRSWRGSSRGWLDGLCTDTTGLLLVLAWMMCWHRQHWTSHLYNPDADVLDLQISTSTTMVWIWTPLTQWQQILTKIASHRQKTPTYSSALFLILCLAAEQIRGSFLASPHIIVNWNSLPKDH